MPQNHLVHKGLQGITYAEFPVHNEILAHCEREQSIDCHEATKAIDERGHMGRAVPTAVLNSVSENIARVIEAATLEITIDLGGFAA